MKIKKKIEATETCFIPLQLLTCMYVVYTKHFLLSF